AVSTRTGLLEAATEGTLFLDEIGDMPLHMQAKILHVCQSGEFYRVGGTKRLKTHARIISASNKDLRKEVLDRHFREDLYYRLAVLVVSVPSLSRRRVDVALLASEFLSKLRPDCSLSDEASAALTLHDWPGNVRELQSVIERIAAFAQGPIISE